MLCLMLPAMALGVWCCFRPKVAFDGYFIMVIVVGAAAAAVGYRCSLCSSMKTYV